MSANNGMVIRGLNIILLMSTGVIAAKVCIFAPVSGLFRQPNTTLVGLGNTMDILLFKYIKTHTLFIVCR